MSKLKFVISFKPISKYILLSLLLTSCSSNNVQHFSNAPDPSMKMKLHTTILNAETHQLLNSMVESVPQVNFEYKEITMQ